MMGMPQSTPFLDELAAQERIAPDWPAGLRAVAPGIDAKVAQAFKRVSAADGYLPKPLDGTPRIWRAYEVPLSGVRVLILGQDPYPDAAHATGLSFSTGPGGPIPDSLANIYNELVSAGYPRPSSGDLTPWTSQGVMLLNRALTYPTDQNLRPRRHVRLWSPLVTATMKALAAEAQHRHVAALLWGVPAHRARTHLGPKVKVFASSHPSPMSVARTAGEYRTFRDSNPFGQVNDWFEHERQPKIDWTLP